MSTPFRSFFLIVLLGLSTLSVAVPVAVARPVAGRRGQGVAERAVVDVVDELAPTAYVLNFTNPAGIITEALTPALGDDTAVVALVEHCRDHLRRDEGLVAERDHGGAPATDSPRPSGRPGKCGRLPIVPTSG